MNAPSISTCEYWFRRFKQSDFNTDDRERSGQPKKVEDGKLKTLIDQDPCQTQLRLAKSLNVSRSTISRHLKKLQVSREKTEPKIFNK